MYLFIAIGVFFLALQMNELKLHVVEQDKRHRQDTIIAADRHHLPGVQLVSRHCRPWCSGLRPRNDGSSIDSKSQILEVFEIPKPRGSCRVLTFSAFGLQGYGPTNEGNFKQLWIPWQF
jgi:hypothetical protein